jgi:peptide/nickel transport system substrate-binding protein
MSRKRLAIIVSFIVVLVLLTNFITPVNASTISSIHTWELTFNPSGPYFNDQRLNPFAIPEIRAAMNQLINRQWIDDNIFGGTVTPLWLPISHFLDEYPGVKTEYDALEAAYAHDTTTAESIISTELLTLGATKVGDLWYYAGEPLEIIMVIRVEDERQAIGDYVKGLLEDIGFTVTALYKTSAEASLIWLNSDPAEGQWHIYTGAWVTYAEPGTPWNELANFQFYYTQDSLYNFSPLWAAYDPDPAFRTLADDLDEDLFATPAARHDAIVSGLEYALEDSVRIWLAERPYSNFYLPLIRR